MEELKKQARLLGEITRELSFSESDLEELKNAFESVNLDKLLPKSRTLSKKQALKNINNAYKNEELVLVLGAGISIEFGVPSWKNLLQNLMVHTIKKENKTSNVLSSLFNDIFTPNPLIAGRYLQDYFENNDSSFETMVRDVMYSEINKDVDSMMLNEIVKLCASPGKSPNLNSVVSYNFDDILEYKLDKTKIGIPYKSIYGIGMDFKNGELPIYHVHGYLPQTKKLNSSNKITFGENNYHQQYSDIYCWNNIVQINKFRDNTCLFIGSSLTDPNIRRLLDIALEQKGNKRKYHYIFKERLNIEKLKGRLESVLTEEHFKKQNNANLDIYKTVKFLNEIYKRFEENDSASFGVKTIWINDWKEVPIILQKMRENVA